MINKTFGKNKHKVPVTIFNDAEELGKVLAKEILYKISEAKDKKRPFLLGCPGGRSPQSTYFAIGEQAKLSGADLSHVVIVMMDDYVVQKGKKFVYCPKNAHYSCHRFARKDILNVINKGIKNKFRIQKKNVWFPDPANISEYDIKLKKAGGVDLFLIASGASDGHVAFNPHGSPIDSKTRIVKLAETTRKDNIKTFPKFKSIDDVPHYGVSVGLETLTLLSKEVILVIHGQNKKEAARYISALDDFTPDWPVSIIFRCKKPRIFIDKTAYPSAISTSIKKNMKDEGMIIDMLLTKLLQEE
ncbi:MAG: 6-phosphogluconolactonase [Elusimicrobia bacterium]|nr:6-phosphogluconolactonase [Elusimicrobiota bacterium]